MGMRRKLRLFAYVLPFLVARALLPAGFMPTVQGGELQLAFCGFSFAAPAQGDDHSGPDPTAGDHACTFAQPAFAALPVLPAELPPDLTPRIAPFSPAQFIAKTGPPRTAGSRAPPAPFSA